MMHRDTIVAGLPLELPIVSTEGHLVILSLSKDLQRHEMPYYTYMLTNSLSTVLYIGVTNNLEARLLQHRRGETPGFTSRYNVHKLVYYEAYDYVTDAIAREKQLKGWRRSKKASLVEAMNKDWKDLSADWYR